MTETNASVVNRLFRKEALSFSAYSLAEAPDNLRLHQNESHHLSKSDRLELAKLFADALSDTGSINHYPSLASERLLDAYSRSLGVLVENVEVTAGSSQALTLLAEAFFAEGRTVAVTKPSFSLYSSLANLYSARVEPIELDDQFEFRRESLFNPAVLASEVAIICSPNNPTGTVCDKELILKFADAYRGVLVVDEAYIDFADNASKQTFIHEAIHRPNVVVLRTLSKAWAAAGLRVGCMIANKDIIRVMRALKPPYSIAWPSEVLAVHVLESKAAQIEVAVQEIRRQKDILCDFLNNCGQVSFVSRSQANFVFFRTHRADQLERGFLEHGILIRRYHGDLLRNAVRVSMPPASEFDRVHDVLNQYLK